VFSVKVTKVSSRYFSRWGLPSSDKVWGEGVPSDRTEKGESWRQDRDQTDNALAYVITLLITS
jgi:hypothetical protein